MPHFGRAGIAEDGVGAKSGAELFFQGGDDSGREFVDLGFGQGGFAALKDYAHEEREFPRRDVFAAEEVGGFDGNDFRNAQRLDGLPHLGEGDPVREE